MAEDQRPAEQRVERDPAEAQPQHRRGRSSAATKSRSSWNSSHGAETTYRRGETSGPRWQAPATGRTPASDVADMPQQQPKRRHRRPPQPQAGAKVRRTSRTAFERGPSAVAIIGEEAVSRPEQSSAEGEGEVERQRRRRQLQSAPSQPISSTSVAWISLLRQVGEDQRPGERESRPEFGAPGIGVLSVASWRDAASVAPSRAAVRRKALAARARVR